MDKDEISEKLLPTEGCGRDELRELYLMGDETAAKRKVVFRRLAAQQLLGIGREYLKKPDERLILMALAHCCNRSLPIPKWCEKAFLSAYTSIIWEYKADSWDAAFGKPFRKGLKLGAKQTEKEKSHAVWAYIQRRQKEDPSLSLKGNREREGLFEEAGKRFAISPAKASDYFYLWKNHHEKPTG